MDQELLRAADPMDFLAHLAYADHLEEQGDAVSAALARGRGHLLRWACEVTGSLAWITGKGSGWKRAYFARGRNRRAVVIAFRADRYDVPEDDAELTAVDARSGRIPWLRAQRLRSYQRFGDDPDPNLPEVWRGASVREFVRAVLVAEGNWNPLEG